MDKQQKQQRQETLVALSLNVPKLVLDQVDALVAGGAAVNRSEFVRTAIVVYIHDQLKGWQQ